MKEFLSDFLMGLSKELNIEIYPLSRQKTKLEKAFVRGILKRTCNYP
ncbi:hypothetical protein NLA70_000046 [Campylobacter jejuni]|nr:hypothetical protein [Campylobacter jejuni]EJK3758211.1 hypothetical protein [Campylobacter jejuni]